MKKDYWKKYGCGIICSCGILLVLLSLVYELLFAGPSFAAGSGLQLGREDVHSMISVYLFFSGLTLFLIGTGMSLYYRLSPSRSHHHGSDHPRVLQ